MPETLEVKNIPGNSFNSFKHLPRIKGIYKMASSDTVTLVSKTEEEEKKGLKMQDNLLY